jgi:hypothetical protein
MSTRSFSWHPSGEQLRYYFEHCRWGLAEELSVRLLAQELPPKRSAGQVYGAYIAHRRMLRVVTERTESELAQQTSEITSRLRELAQRADLDPIVPMATEMFIFRLSDERELVFARALDFVDAGLRPRDGGRVWEKSDMDAAAIAANNDVGANIEAHAVLECIGLGVRAANEISARHDPEMEHPTAPRVAQGLSELMPDYVSNPALREVEACANAYFQLSCSALCNVMGLHDAQRYLGLARACLPNTLLHAATFSPMRVVEADLAAREAREGEAHDLARALEEVVPFARDAAVWMMQQQGLTGTLRRYEELPPRLRSVRAG